MSEPANDLIPRSATLLLLIVVWLGGCSSLSYDTQFDETVDFSQYRTFGWMPDSQDSTGYDTLLKQRIDQAITNELIIRGLAEADSSPDMLVAYHISTEELVTGATTSNWGYGWGGWGYGGTVDYSQYTEGTIFLDLIDAAEKRAIYRGTANGAVEDKIPSQARVNEVVAKLLAAYPRPRASGS